MKIISYSNYLMLLFFIYILVIDLGSPSSFSWIEIAGLLLYFLIVLNFFGKNIVLSKKEAVVKNIFFSPIKRIEVMELIEFDDYMTFAWMPVLSRLTYWKGYKKKEIFFFRLFNPTSIKEMNEYLERMKLEFQEDLA